MPKTERLQEANQDARARLALLSMQVDELAMQPDATKVSRALRDLAGRLRHIGCDLGSV